MLPLHYPAITFNYRRADGPDLLDTRFGPPYRLAEITGGEDAPVQFGPLEALDETHRRVRGLVSVRETETGSSAPVSFWFHPIE